MIKDSVIHPEISLGSLFKEVALSQIFQDGKAWADAIPLTPLETIKTLYLQQKDSPDFNLEKFIDLHFKFPVSSTSETFTSDISKTTEEHINSLWSYLKRQGASNEKINSTLIHLPYPYIVPGGRFNEIYYWDSYFTMLGLEVAGEYNMIHSMVENFAWMINNFGFIPNGNRSYYLSRSQPPFFALMVELLCQTPLKVDKSKYLNELLTEYHFWTDETNNRSVKINETQSLNRYYDNLNSPRIEMYAKDYELKGAIDDTHFYTNIKAACESGWDFSTRWLLDPHNLKTIATIDIIPVDLNCLLYTLEQTISSIYNLKSDSINAKLFENKATKRSESILKYFWNEDQGYFFDYNYVTSTQTTVIILAGLFPLFIGICPPNLSNKAINFAIDHLMKDGGLATTNIFSGQQWDAPNGWAPLQWISFIAMKNYHHDDEAKNLANKWISLNDRVFKNTGKMMEKYNVENTSIESGGGEYPVQDGFGWTNGVYLALKRALRNEEMLSV